MSSHSGELRILSVYGQGEGPLAVDGHDTLFAASEPEALRSLSTDHSVAKSLNCSVRLVRLEELTGHQLSGLVESASDFTFVYLITSSKTISLVVLDTATGAYVFPRRSAKALESLDFFDGGPD
ncbi:unnamed protein product [Arctogadus glacialis]